MMIAVLVVCAAGLARFTGTCCTPAVLWSTRHAAALTAFLEQHASAKPHDLLTDDFARQADIPRYAALLACSTLDSECYQAAFRTSTYRFVFTPSLFQHIGLVSARPAKQHLASQPRSAQYQQLKSSRSFTRAWGSIWCRAVVEAISDMGRRQQQAMHAPAARQTLQSNHLLQNSRQ